MEYPRHITSGDERIGKTAFVLRTGDRGTIDKIMQYENGLEVFHLDRGNGCGCGGLEAAEIVIQEVLDPSWHTDIPPVPSVAFVEYGGEE